MKVDLGYFAPRFSVPQQLFHAHCMESVTDAVIGPNQYRLIQILLSASVASRQAMQMARQLNRIFYTSCILCFCWMLNGRLKADEATIQRFKEEAPSAWRTIISSYDNTSFSLARKTRDPSAPLPKTICYQRKNDIRIDTSLDVNGKRILDVELANTYYAAKVSDPLGTGKLLLMGAEPRQPSHPRQLSNSIINYTYVRPSLMIGGIYLPESFVGVGDFPERLKIGHLVRDAVSEIGEDGKEVVRLQVEMCEQDDRGEFVPIKTKGGFSNVRELTLLPSRNWCAVEFSGPVRTGPSDKIIEGTHSEFIYFESAGAHPKSKRTIITFAGNTSDKTFEYSVCSRADVPSDFYHVTSLGLSELDQFIPKLNYVFWSLIAIGVVMIALGVFVGRRMKTD